MASGFHVLYNSLFLRGNEGRTPLSKGQQGLSCRTKLQALQGFGVHNLELSNWSPHLDGCSIYTIDPEDFAAEAFQDLLIPVDNLRWPFDWGGEVRGTKDNKETIKSYCKELCFSTFLTDLSRNTTDS